MSTDDNEYDLFAGIHCRICGDLMPYTPNARICCRCCDAMKRENYVQVVRCKDCKISTIEKVFKNVPESKETVRWCELIQRYVDDDWFCADGEKKMK